MKLDINIAARKRQFGFHFAVELEEPNATERGAAVVLALIQAALATALTILSLQSTIHMISLRFLPGM